MARSLAVTGVMAMATALSAVASAQDASGAPEAPTVKPAVFASADAAAAAAPAPRRGSAVLDAAAVYATYQADVGYLRDNALSSTRDIDRALDNLGGQNPEALAQGWLAYSALVAAQSPAFREEVRKVEASYGREQTLTYMRDYPNYARTFEGGEDAVAASLAAIAADMRRISATADFVTEQAYSLQATGWAKGRFSNASGRAEQLFAATRRGRPAHPTLAATISNPAITPAFALAGYDDAPSLWDTIGDAASRDSLFEAPTGRPASSRRVAAGHERTADRIATIAAYYVLEEDGANSAPVRTAMSDRQKSGCMNMAQLNLQQCVAASYRHYEVPFCIGQHALTEIGHCIGDIAQ